MIYTVTLNPSVDRTLHLRRLAVGGLNRALSVGIDLAGKGVNVSVALRRLGSPSVLLGFVGGVTGGYLEQGLRARGHECAFCNVQGETRSNLTLVDDVTGAVTKINEPGPTVTMADLDALQASLDRVTRGDICVLSGSLPPGAPSDLYARLVQGLQACGAFVAVDTSGDALAATLVSEPDLIKPNLAEANEALGRDREASGSLADLLGALCARGARRVLLSLGAQGAVYDAGDDALWARPPSVVEANAVGAGDALLAGWLYAQAGGATEAASLGWAVACGTAAAMLDGSALPTREAAERVRAKVRVCSLDDLATSE